MSDDIEERIPLHSMGRPIGNFVMIDPAELDALRRQLAEAREALKPFAKLNETAVRDGISTPIVKVTVVLDDLRCAAAVLAKGEQK